MIKLERLRRIVCCWPSGELPINRREGRFRRRSGPDELSGRTAACDPKLTSRASHAVSSDKYENHPNYCTKPETSNANEYHQSNND